MSARGQTRVVAAAGAVAIASAAMVMAAAAYGARPRPWEVYIGMGTLIIWVAYAVMLRYLADCLSRESDRLVRDAAAVFRIAHEVLHSTPGEDEDQP